MVKICSKGFDWFKKKKVNWRRGSKKEIGWHALTIIVPVEIFIIFQIMVKICSEGFDWFKKNKPATRAAFFSSVTPLVR